MSVKKYQHGERASERQFVDQVHSIVNCVTGPCIFATQFLLLNCLVAQDLAPVEGGTGLIGEVREVTVRVAEADGDAPTAGGIEDREAIKKANNEKYAGGAPLKTNPEMEELMKRAELFAGENSFRNATLLWQRVLERSGDSMFTSDGETYYSLAREVERRISKLPEEGMRIYRVSADGESRAILAQATSPADQNALAKIVDNFFLSSVGDEAAFDLGCLALDQHDFVGASRLFRKIIDEYPSPSVPLDQVYLRLALANAHIGDEESARDAIEQARQLAANDSGDLLDLIANNIKTFALASTNVSDTAREYRMRLAEPNRIGVMPAPPEDALETDLTAEWQLRFDPKSNNKNRSVIEASSPIARVADSGKESGDGKQEKKRTSGKSPFKDDAHELIKSWNDKHWIPAGQLLISDSQIYFRTLNDVTSWRTDLSTDTPAWRSLWLNQYVRDDLTEAYELYRKNFNGQKKSGKRPESAEEVFFFGDRIHHSMLLHEDVLYAVEGESFSRFSGPPRKSSRQNFNVYGGSIPRRTRTNYLTAYDAITGKLLWDRPAAEPVAKDPVSRRPSAAATESGGVEKATDEDEDDQPNVTNAEDTSFMSAPIPYGNMLICPVSEGGAIYLCGMDRMDKGRTVWRSYLCDEPGSGAAPWSPIEVAVEGRDAYVVCGTGAVFAVDAVSGTIRFARRYVRDEQSSPIRTNHNRGSSKVPKGWDDDIVIPYGNALIVMASDHDNMFAIDRRSGELIWDAPRGWIVDDHEATYCLGVYNDKLYCAGPRVVICYDVAGEGRLSWVHELEEEHASYGRGFVCSNGVYIPSGKSIMRLGLEKGDVIGQAQVSLDTNANIGNLFCDGNRIWVIGVNRVFALASIRSRIKSLNKQVEQGDTQALLQRMQLNAQTAEYNDAFADLQALFAAATTQLEGDNSSDELFQQIMAELANGRLVGEYPERVIGTLYHTVKSAPAIAGAKLRHLISTHRPVIMETLNATAGMEPNQRLMMIYKAADLLPEMNDHFAIAKLIEGFATPGDLAGLLYTTGKNPELAAATVGPIMKLTTDDTQGELIERTVFAEQAIALLKELSANKSPQVSFAASVELLNIGDTDGLIPMVELLNSDDGTIRRLAANILQRSTGRKVPYSAVSDRAERAVAVRKWREWIDSEGANLKLIFPFEGDVSLRNRTLICVQSRQRLIEYETTSNEDSVWERKLPAVHAAKGLPNGNRVVVFFQTKRVVELDAKDKQRLIYRTTDGNPSGVEVLPNGNFLISVSRSKKHAVVEVDDQGKTVWEYKPEKTAVAAMSASRLKNGNTLIAIQSSNSVIEVDKDGKIVWKKEGLGSPHHAQRLENGNTLIAEFSRGRVIEIDRERERVWSKSGIQQPRAVLRREDGHTLIGHAKGLLEVDAKGEEVNKRNLGPVTSIHCY